MKNNVIDQVENDENHVAIPAIQQDVEANDNALIFEAQKNKEAGEETKEKDEEDPFTGDEDIGSYKNTSFTSYGPFNLNPEELPAIISGWKAVYDKQMKLFDVYKVVSILIWHTIHKKTQLICDWIY